MNRIVRCLCCLSAIGFFLSSAGAVNAEQVTLTADLVRFDPKTKIVTADGNVRINRTDAKLRGDWGQGLTETSEFRLEGNVKGSFDKEGLKIQCEELLYKGRDADRVIEAKGNVDLKRGADFLLAGTVRWVVQTEDYSAHDKVFAHFGNYEIEAQSVVRKGQDILAEKVSRYQDLVSGNRISGDEFKGFIERKSGPAQNAKNKKGVSDVVGEEVTEMTVKGNVVIWVREGERPTRVRGDNAVYSKERGTIVVSGNAVAEQTGRVVRAGSLVLHLDSNRIEAMGRPEIVFDIKEKK